MLDLYIIDDCCPFLSFTCSDLDKNPERLQALTHFSTQYAPTLTLLNEAAALVDFVVSNRTTPNGSSPSSNVAPL